MKPGKELLIVDDDTGLLESLEMFFSLRDWDVTTCSDPTRALSVRKECGARTVLLDIMMPGVDGISLLEEFKKLPIPVDVIIMTGQTTTGRAYDAWVHGAFDYVLKPFSSEGEVEEAVLRAWDNQQRWRRIGSETIRTVKNRDQAA